MRLTVLAALALALPAAIPAVEAVADSITASALVTKSNFLQATAHFNVRGCASTVTGVVEYVAEDVWPQLWVGGFTVPPGTCVAEGGSAEMYGANCVVVHATITYTNGKVLRNSAQRCGVGI